MSLMKNIKRVGMFGYIALLGLAFAPASSALAAAHACKGVSKSECGSMSSCIWVEGYTTKKGTKVDAYCRVKSSKSGSSGEAGKSSKAGHGDKTTKKTDTEKKTSDS